MSHSNKLQKGKLNCEWLGNCFLFGQYWMENKHKRKMGKHKDEAVSQR